MAPADPHFVNAFTDTIDLSALRRRLEIEDADSVDRTDYIPRLYRRNRRGSGGGAADAGGDVESTQILGRGSARSRGGSRTRWDTSRSSTTRRSDAPPRADAADAADAAAQPDPGLDVLAEDAAQARGRAAARRPARDAGSGRRRRNDLGVERIADKPGDPTDTGERPAGGNSTKVKAVWTLADQAVSSATNAAISLLIARQVSETDYGAFAVAYILFSVVIGIARAGGCLPLSISYSGKPPPAFRAAASAATGTSFSFGVLVGAVMVGAGALLGGAVGSAVMAMGFVLPGLLLQDAWRYVFFAMGRPQGAFLNDIAWATVQVLGLSLLIQRGVSASSPMLFAWGVAALIAALLGIAQAGFWPAPTKALAWLRENRANTINLTLEFITVQGALQASILMIGVVGSLATVGALNGVRTILGPQTVVGVGIVSFAVPEFSRRIDMSARARERAAVLLSVIVVGIGSVWSLIFLVIPDSVGRSLLGVSWPAVNNILGLSALQYAGTAVGTGAACILYALGKTNLTFRLNLTLAPMLLVFPMVGILLWDAPGAVIGYNIAFWSIAPLWFIVLRRVVREQDEIRARERAADAGPPGPSEPSERRTARERERPARSKQARRLTGAEPPGEAGPAGDNRREEARQDEAEATALISARRDRRSRAGGGVGGKGRESPAQDAGPVDVVDDIDVADEHRRGRWGTGR